MLDRGPRAVRVLLHVAGSNEFVQNALSRPRSLQLLRLLLQMRLEALQLSQLLLHALILRPLRLPLRLHLGRRSTPLRSDLEHVRSRTALQLK